MTGWATDEELRLFEKEYNYLKNLEERRADILRLMKEKEVLTPELEKAIIAVQTLATLEDIYRPFKEKKNTRATKAIAKWLQPLADILLESKLTKDEFEKKSEEFVNDTWDEKTSVKTAQEAIQWAQDVVAEIVSDSADLRTYIKDREHEKAVLITKPTKTFEDEWVYKIYKEYNKQISSIPSYAYLAICRAEKEKQLSVSSNFNQEYASSEAERLFVPWNANSSKEYLIEAIHDWLKRLIFPSIEREIRADKKQRADTEAIDVFGKNVQELLLLPPVKGKVILGFDPAYRTGCKIAVIDATGKVLDHTVIYPTKPQNDYTKSAATITDLITKHTIQLIVIGNGTWSRESEQFMAKVIADNNLSCQFMIVSEAWASVYSASELANKEYPDYDVTIRGAINIAQRVQDPLSTYVKIDPKSLGVGQYQHDVDQKLLKEMLDKKIEDAVNRVGTDVNTASPALLQHIAWLSEKMAKAIVDYRDEHGIFSSRSQIKKAKWLGPKAFEQCAGFLRIAAAKEPLDCTGIHPESYKVTYELLEDERWVKKKDLQFPYVAPQSDHATIAALAEKYSIGEETLNDIIKELANPWLDPRETFDEGQFKSDILTLEDLEKGMELTGVVRNIVDFGVFVDIGLKNDWLIHKSQLADGYVGNLFDLVSVGQTVSVKVADIDKERQRVWLSSKHSIKGNTWWQSSQPRREAYSRPQTDSLSKKQKESEPVIDTKEWLVWGNISFS